MMTISSQKPIGERIANEILMYMRVKKKLQRESSYYEPIGTDKEGNEIRLLDIMESGEPPALEQIGLKDDTKKLYRLLEQILPERERQVLVMRYGLYQGKEYTQREIAGKLGISRSYISRIEKKRAASPSGILSGLSLGRNYVILYPV